MTNEQTDLWRGPDGDAYHERNTASARTLRIDTLQEFFRLPAIPWPSVRAVLELGAGRGDNLRAIKRDHPLVVTAGVEVNHAAYRSLELAADHTWHQDLLAFQPTEHYDLVVTKGVLVHLARERLSTAFACIDACAPSYVLLAEYYAPRAEEVPYLGRSGTCWRDDYASLFTTQCPGYEVVDYGFCWHGDASCPLDDVTWFLLEGSSARAKHLIRGHDPEAPREPPADGSTAINERWGMAWKAPVGPDRFGV